MEAQQWNAERIVRNIVGDARVVSDVDSWERGKVCVSLDDWPNYGAGLSDAELAVRSYRTGKWGNIVPTIYLTDLDGSDAMSLAAAAHEASHAALHLDFGDELFKDEARANAMAKAWLVKNVGGFKLHAALELIAQSNISYGCN